MAPVVADEESLEALIEGIRRREAEEEDDAEVALDDLIERMADIRAEPMGTEDLVREDEFVCRSCDMILNRSLLARREGTVCVECALPSPE
jgi:Domain of unknown function (DUF4193)